MTLSSDKIVGNLFCRVRRAGDKIKRGGISKDVRKLMSEHKIPIKDRDRLPVVCDDEGILWIPGIALRDGTEQKENTKTITLSVFKKQ